MCLFEYWTTGPKQLHKKGYPALDINTPILTIPSSYPQPKSVERELMTTTLKLKESCEGDIVHITDTGEQKPCQGIDTDEEKPCQGIDSGEEKPCQGIDSGEEKPCQGIDSGETKSVSQIIQELEKPHQVT